MESRELYFILRTYHMTFDSFSLYDLTKAKVVRIDSEHQDSLRASHCIRHLACASEVSFPDNPDLQTRKPRYRAQVTF